MHGIHGDAASTRNAILEAARLEGKLFFVMRSSNRSHLTGEIDLPGLQVEIFDALQELDEVLRERRKDRIRDDALAFVATS
jgi:hypothetical protein